MSVTTEQPSATAEEIVVEGIFEPGQNKTGTLLDPKRNGKARPSDPFVPRELVRRFKIKRGSTILAKAQQDPRHPNPKVRFIDAVDGLAPEERKRCPDFTNLTTITPDEQLITEMESGEMTTRVVDLFCPIGKGTRGLIVAPPRTGKTTLLRDIALGILENHSEDAHVMMLLVDERPEEVTDMLRSIPGAEIFASSNDERLENHIAVAEMTIERARRLCEAGKDVVVLLDSITRLSRAFNAKSGSGRTMSGGLDVRALEKPRQLFSAARNTEEAGSLTIIASALIETGSRMDELIFQEFKGTGNMEMVLDRKVAELRIWPAINLSASGTRREELILDKRTLEGASFFRRAISSMKTEDAAETTVSRMATTKSNAEFLRLIER